MKFTVLWTPHAESELIRIWTDALDRQGITNAANQIDAQLRQDAHELGESREKGRRVLYVAPLGIIFKVNSLDLKVEVFDVWRFETRQR